MWLIFYKKTCKLQLNWFQISFNKLFENFKSRITQAITERTQVPKKSDKKHLLLKWSKTE